MRKKRYKYETHSHTSETSLCGQSSAEQLIRFFKNLDYTGVIITDHLYTPETVNLQDKPWEALVERHCSGYDIAAAVGAQIGIDVMFAWEYSYGWAHFLTYGLGKEWLLDNPDIFEWDIFTYFDRIHADGGRIVHAHPFREGVEHIHLFPSKIDAVEAINMGRVARYNRHARDFAVSFNLPQTAGSDIHLTIDSSRLGGVTSSERFADTHDYMDAVLAGEVSLFGSNI